MKVSNTLWQGSRCRSGLRFLAWILSLGLYKPPLDKGTGDLWWRIVHGTRTTNKYLVCLNPGTGEDCPFCSQPEMVPHLFIVCSRLANRFQQIKFMDLEVGGKFFFLFMDPVTMQRKRQFTKSLTSFLAQYQSNLFMGLWCTFLVELSPTILIIILKYREWGESGGLEFSWKTITQILVKTF